MRVQTKQDGRVGPQERLVVTRTVGEKPRTSYHLSNAASGVRLEELVRGGAERHRVEQVFQEGKGEVGLGHYEVRSWVGWQHHMTLSLLALWFLALERGRVGGGKDLLTVSQLREVFTRLLRTPRPTARQIAEEISRVLRRNEEARIYHWYASTGSYPPPRQGNAQEGGP